MERGGGSMEVAGGGFRCGGGGGECSGGSEVVGGRGGGRTGEGSGFGGIGRREGMLVREWGLLGERRRRRESEGGDCWGWDCGTGELRYCTKTETKLYVLVSLCERSEAKEKRAS